MNNVLDRFKEMIADFEKQRIEYEEFLKEPHTFREILSKLNGVLGDMIVSDLSKLTKTSNFQIRYGWGIDRNYPPEIKQDIVSNYMNKPVEELFPKKQD